MLGLTEAIYKLDKMLGEKQVKISGKAMRYETENAEYLTKKKKKVGYRKSSL